MRTTSLLSLVAALSCATVARGAEQFMAVAVMQPVSADAVSSGATGTIVFERACAGGEDFNTTFCPVKATIDFQNVPDGLSGGVHGIHVHQYGDKTSIDGNGAAELGAGPGKSFGKHFVQITKCDPVIGGVGDTTCNNDAHHGYPPSVKRQTGDMGNITCTATDCFFLPEMTKTKTFGQNKMSLAHSRRSIVGRSVVIHKNADKGPDFQPWGDAGEAIVAGIIGIADVADTDTNGARGPALMLDRMVCVFDDVVGWVSNQASLVRSGVKGYAYIDKTFLERETRIRVHFESLGTHKSNMMSFHFHKNGDLRPVATDQKPSSLGPIFNATVAIYNITEAEAAPNKCFDRTFVTHGEYLDNLFGRSLTLHQAGLDSPTVAMAVCGIAHQYTKPPKTCPKENPPPFGVSSNNAAAQEAPAPFFHVVVGLAVALCSAAMVSVGQQGSR